MRPARAEAQTVDQAFALAGRVFPSPNKTQGDALGYEFVGPTGRLNINTLAQLIFHYKSSVAHLNSASRISSVATHKSTDIHGVCPYDYSLFKVDSYMKLKKRGNLSIW